MDTFENAIAFFENEIKQFELILQGILRPEYRKYIEDKKAYYELALNALQNENVNVA